MDRPFNVFAALAISTLTLSCSNEAPLQSESNSAVKVALPVQPPDTAPNPGKVFKTFLELAELHRDSPTKAITKKPFIQCNTDNPDGLEYGFCTTMSGEDPRFVVQHKRRPKAYRFESEPIILKREARCEDFGLARIKSYRNPYEAVDYCRFEAGPMEGFTLYVRNGKKVPESFLVVFSPTFLSESKDWRETIERGGM